MRLHRQLGLAYLRLAEQENCVARHNAECCLFPLEGGAVHTERAPAEKAKEHQLGVLALAPDDPREKASSDSKALASRGTTGHLHR